MGGWNLWRHGGWRAHVLIVYAVTMFVIYSVIPYKQPWLGVNLWLPQALLVGWFVADLHRHIVPYYGFRLLCRAMGWHRIVRIDGTISIASSFRVADWQNLLARAGVTAEIKWRMMFRLCVGRLK